MLNDLSSRTINFRLAEASDAAFINSLRVNEKFNQHLSKTSGDVNAQEKWLLTYKEREKLGREYYFIIQKNDDNSPIGTVRLYDFIDEKKSFCWGSWILNENKTKFSALESALLIYKIAFEQLDFEMSHFDVRKENVKVIEFHEKLGAKRKCETLQDIYFEFFKSDFFVLKKNFSKYMVK